MPGALSRSLPLLPSLVPSWYSPITTYYGSCSLHNCHPLALQLWPNRCQLLEIVALASPNQVLPLGLVEGRLASSSVPAASGRPRITCDAGFLWPCPCVEGPASLDSCLGGLGRDPQPSDLPESLPALPMILLRKEGRLWI